MSVWVFAAQDRNFIVHTQSGFSCASLSTATAFGADLSADQHITATGWTEVSGWESSGVGGRLGLFQSGRNFDAASGRFSVGSGVSQKSGPYFCSAALLLNGAELSYFQISIAVNNYPTTENGMHMRMCCGCLHAADALLHREPCEYLS